MVLPPLEEWDSNNEFLYHYYEIKMPDGTSEMGVMEMPFPIEQVFFRRRKIPTSILNAPQYNNCKYCGKELWDGYWRRMHMCRDCSFKKPWAKPLFQLNEKGDITCE